MATIKRFEDLEVWQIARELCQYVRRLTTKEDFSRNFSLKDQIEKSSGSTMDNIAEGFGRGGRQEFVQFLWISHGSTDEVKSQLYRALDYQNITEEEFKEGYELAHKLNNKLISFINYLNNSRYKGIKYHKGNQSDQQSNTKQPNNLKQ